jgi:hypothetical protein
MTPEILVDAICQSITKAFDGKNRNQTMCIHIPEKVEEAIRRYCKENPTEAAMAMAKAHGGNKEDLKHLVKNMFIPSDEKPCDDVLCLACRCERMMNESKDGGPWSLEAMKDFLGMDVMLSIKWTNDILAGTIKSTKSSDAHKKKATFAKTKMFPSLMASAAMVHGLQKDLKEAIEARDKYHKLADFLMDAESDPDPAS